MAGNCGCDPLARLCRRASDCSCGYVWLDGCDERPCRKKCCRETDCTHKCCACRPGPNSEACRQMPFWPCWNTDDLIEARRPRPCCLKCGCCDKLERQGRFVRCCGCGWIGIFEECFTVCCGLRSCCDNLLWPCRPGEPR